MKFRSIIREPNCMRDFHNIIITLTKLSKECILDIRANAVVLAVNEQLGSNLVPMVWIELKPQNYFTEFKMENEAGLDDVGEQHIILSVAVAHLGRALGVLRQNAIFCKLKLTNLQFPCLTVEANLQYSIDDQSLSRSVTHDIPVTIIPRSDWPMYMLPKVPISVVTLKVPADRFMRNLIDKLKNLSPTIIFNASAKGEMNIVVETDLATITTNYSELDLINSNDIANTCNESKCAVDCKKLAHFFAALQLTTVELLCGINEQCIHLEVNARPGTTINAILPAVCM